MSGMTRISTLGFLLVGLAACQSAGEQKPAAQEQARVVKADHDGVQRVTVLAGNYFFKPSRIIVKADTPVEILASREAGMVPHDLVIQAPDGATLIQTAADVIEAIRGLNGKVASPSQPFEPQAPSRRRLPLSRPCI